MLVAPPFPRDLGGLTELLIGPLVCSCVLAAGELAWWRNIPGSHLYFNKARNNFITQERQHVTYIYPVTPKLKQPPL